MTYKRQVRISILLLAAFLFSGCPQSQDVGLEEIPVFPETPQNLKVMPGNQRLIVSWDQAAGANSYELVFWGDGENEVSREENATMVTLGGLENGKNYWVKVRSKNNAGISGFSSPVEATPAVQIPAPSLIRGDGKLSVGWAAETGVDYEVLCGTNPDGAASWNEIVTGSGTVAGTTITGLTNGVSYYVRIKVQVEGADKFSPATGGIPETSPPDIENFAYVSGGTVVGSESYAMNVTVPSVPGYMNAGRTLSKKGVFVEDRVVEIASFLMAKYETSRQLWYDVQSWAESNGYSFQNTISAPDYADKNKPVSGISWRDAIVWCNAYSEKAGLEPVYYYPSVGAGNVLRDSRNANGTTCDGAIMDKSKSGLRLPTEAEREFAARGGDPGKADWMFTYAGSNNANEVAWHHGNSPYEIKDVGQKNPNRLGIFDLSGNVQEWGWDWMNYTIAVTPDTAPDGKPYGSPYIQKSMAGGGAGSNITMSCVADRWGFNTSYTDSFIGFRLVRKVE